MSHKKTINFYLERPQLSWPQNPTSGHSLAGRYKDIARVVLWADIEVKCVKGDRGLTFYSPIRIRYSHRQRLRFINRHQTRNVDCRIAVPIAAYWQNPTTCTVL